MIEIILTDHKTQNQTKIYKYKSRWDQGLSFNRPVDLISSETMKTLKENR